MFSERELVDFSYQVLKIRTSFQNLSDEAIYRVVVSRSYYGAFLAARNKAGIKRASPSIHADVVNHYTSNGSTLIANNLQILRRTRERADYETDKSISCHEAKDCLNRAKKIIDTL